MLLGTLWPFWDAQVDPSKLEQTAWAAHGSLRNMLGWELVFLLEELFPSKALRSNISKSFRSHSFPAHPLQGLSVRQQWPCSSQPAPVSVHPALEGMQELC